MAEKKESVQVRASKVVLPPDFVANLDAREKVLVKSGKKAGDVASWKQAIMNRKKLAILLEEDSK
jgi:hypothetical protein